MLAIRKGGLRAQKKLLTGSAKLVGLVVWGLSAVLHPAGAEQAQAQQEDRSTDFIRLRREKAQAYLETSVTTYQKGDVRVDLIAAVHIADAAYYQGLNERFKKYPVVLFELIGGEALAGNLPEDLDAQDDALPPEAGLPERGGGGGEVKPEQGTEPAQGEEHQASPGFLNAAYQKAAEWLELSEQLNAIDYGAQNLVHADLTYPEYEALKEAKKENLLTTMLKGSLRSTLTPASQQPSSFQLMRGLLQRDADLLKKQLMISLAAGDEMADSVFGDSIIIKDRNAKCLKILAEQIELGHQHLAVFYGGAHFPDMERALLEQGYQLTEQEWVQAWQAER